MSNFNTQSTESQLVAIKNLLDKALVLQWKGKTIKACETLLEARDLTEGGSQEWSAISKMFDSLIDSKKLVNKVASAIMEVTHNSEFVSDYRKLK